MKQRSTFVRSLRNDGVRTLIRSCSAFQAAVAKGDAELDRGEGVEYSAELMNTMTQTALQDMHSDKPIDPDVIP